MNESRVPPRLRHERPRPAGRHWQAQTLTDPDAAHAYFRQNITDLAVDVAPVFDRTFRLHSVATALGDVGLAHLHYSGSAQLTTVPSPDLNATYVLRGQPSIGLGRDDYRLTPGDVGVMPTDQPCTAAFLDMDVINVHLPRALLEETATAAGLAPHDLRFLDARPASAAMARYWRRTVDHVLRSVLGDPVTAASPLLVASARRSLAEAALAVFPNTTMTSDLTRTGPPGPTTAAVPASLRRALAHAEQHADRDITTTELAAAAGTGVRALQHAFTRHLGTTPTGYLRQVRLERAHRDLQAADPTRGETVAAVAARWGFTHPGRFSADYRARYGRPPSHTLRT